MKTDPNSEKNSQGSKKTGSSDTKKSGSSESRVNPNIGESCRKSRKSARTDCAGAFLCAEKVHEDVHRQATTSPSPFIPLVSVNNKKNASGGKRMAAEENAAHFSGDYGRNMAEMDRALRLDASFDLATRDLLLAGKRARLYFVEGFVKSDTLLRICSALLRAGEAELAACGDLNAFARRFIAHAEIETDDRIDSAVTKILSGKTARLV